MALGVDPAEAEAYRVGVDQAHAGLYAHYDRQSNNRATFDPASWSRIWSKKGQVPALTLVAFLYVVNMLNITFNVLIWGVYVKNPDYRRPAPGEPDVIDLDGLASTKGEKSTHWWAGEDDEDADAESSFYDSFIEEWEADKKRWDYISGEVKKDPTRYRPKWLWWLLHVPHLIIGIIVTLNQHRNRLPFLWRLVRIVTFIELPAFCYQWANQKDFSWRKFNASLFKVLKLAEHVTVIPIVLGIGYYQWLGGTLLDYTNMNVLYLWMLQTASVVSSLVFWPILPRL